jgi:MFS family permease
LSKPIERGTWLALAAMGVAVFVLANDFSAINVAIPQIEKDFKTDVTTAQWVVNAYALVFGVLIVTGGRLAAAVPSSSAARSSPCSRLSAERRRARPG